MENITLKKSLRDYFKQERRHSVQAEGTQGAAFLETFQNFLKDQNVDIQGQCIAAYYPFGDEASPLAILEWLLTQPCTVVLPKMQDHTTFAFCLYTKGAPLLKNHFGFLEPETCTPQIPSIILLPLLAVDEQGYRLGYGQGHYDRALEALYAAGKKPLCLGLAYPCQQTKRLPTERQDQKLDALLLPHTSIIF